MEGNTVRSELHQAVLKCLVSTRPTSRPIYDPSHAEIKALRGRGCALTDEEIRDIRTVIEATLNTAREEMTAGDLNWGYENIEKAENLGKALEAAQVAKEYN